MFMFFFTQKGDDMAVHCTKCIDKVAVLLTKCMHGRYDKFLTQ